VRLVQSGPHSKGRGGVGDEGDGGGGEGLGGGGEGNGGGGLGDGEGELGELALQQVFSHFLMCLGFVHQSIFLHFDLLAVSVRPVHSFGGEGGGGEGLGGGGEGEGEGGRQQAFLQFFFCFFFSHSFEHFVGFCFLHAFFSFLHRVLSLRSSQFFGPALGTAASLEARESDVVVGKTTATGDGGAGGGAGSVAAGDGIGDRVGAPTASTLARKSIETRIGIIVYRLPRGRGGTSVVLYGVEAQREWRRRLCV